MASNKQPTSNLASNNIDKAENKIAQTRPPPLPYFFRLPQELRDQIYHHLLQPSLSSSNRVYTAFLAINRQIYAEGTDVLYASNKHTLTLHLQRYDALPPLRLPARSKSMH
jgi:hypothetical protein